MAEKRISVACPRCNTYTEMERGMFGWKKVTCPACKLKYDYDEVGTQILTCESCGKSVAYSLSKKNDCPFCGKPINAQSEKLAIGCPICSLPVYYHRGDTEATCLRCNKTFNPETVRTVIESEMSNTAPDITMTVELGEDQMIWRHPLDRMPLNTRVMAKAGMYAVGMQGMTQKFLVDGQSVMLSETDLRNDAADYQGAAAPMTSVEIFYVRSSFQAQIMWGGMCSIADDYGVVTDYPVTGTVTIERVTDPAAFLRTFGADPAQVKISKFRLINGEPGPFALKVRDRINSVLQKAMEIVRDERGYTTDDMMDHWPEILAEMSRQANNAVAEFGIGLSDMNGQRPARERIKVREIQDILERRVTGPISWKLERPVYVHPADDVAAMVGLVIKGKARVDIVQRDRFRGCKEAHSWRNPANSDNIAREEFATYVAEVMQSRFLADIQQIINQTHCDIRFLEAFVGSLVAKAEAMLNREDGFFTNCGLHLRDITVSIELGEKSAAYRENEELEAHVHTTTTGQKRDDVDTARFVHDQGTKRDRMGAQTETTVFEIEQTDAVDAARHKAEMAREQRKSESAAQQRQIAYEAWSDKQRLLREQEEIDYARARRAQLEKQQGQITSAEHQERMFAIAQRIEESKLSWREKLDAYARLQRGIAFRDQMDEREVTVDAEQREARMRQALHADDLRIIGELKHEEALREEELTKQRFAREMELRRQKMAEEAAQLEAQFERERAIAEEQEKRSQAREEIETLRLMLEYLAKSGEQQVTQESLREARAQAQLAWEREHEAAERKAAEARHQEQAAAQREMAERAMELMSQATAMRNEAHRQEGKPVVDVNALQGVIAQLNAICEAIKGNGAPAAQPAGNPMNAWLDAMISKAGKGGAAPTFVPNHGNAGNAGSAGRNILCGNCGKSFDANAYMCPFCGWMV